MNRRFYPRSFVSQYHKTDYPLMSLDPIVLVSGAPQASVILSPLALLLLPISFVIIGTVFLKDKEEAEFV